MSNHTAKASAMSHLKSSKSPAALVILGLLGVSVSCAQADEPKNEAGGHLAITRKLVPRYDDRTQAGALGETWVVLPQTDGGVIVAGIGSNNNAPKDAAYAAKIGKDGTVSWSHTVESKEELSVHWKPKYACGVSMDDGSIFLAGTMPAADKVPRKPRFGILTHLAKDGIALSNQLPLLPTMKHGSVEFMDGGRLGENAVFLAYGVVE